MLRRSVVYEITITTTTILRGTLAPPDTGMTTILPQEARPCSSLSNSDNESLRSKKYHIHTHTHTHTHTHSWLFDSPCRV